MSKPHPDFRPVRRLFGRRVPTATGLRNALRTVSVIAGNELRRLATDRTALGFSLVLPVAIMVVIGSTFGAGSDLTVGVVDRDGSPASDELVAAVEGAGDVEVESRTDLDALRRDVRAGSLAAGLVVPDGYGAGLDAATPVQVELVVDPTSNDAAAARTAVEAAVGDEAARVAAARLAAGDGASGPEVEEARAAVEQLAAELPRSGVQVQEVGDDGGLSGSGDLGAFAYTAPSNLVLFGFVTTLAVGAALAGDRRRGLTRRMLASPHRPVTIMAGIGTAKLAFSLVQSALILAIGAVAFGVPWGSPVAAVLLVGVFCAVSTSVGLLVGATVGNPEQAQAIATPVAVALGMLGGCMWPLEIVPPAMRAVGHIAPHAWAMDAWIILIFDRGGLSDILPQLAVLTVEALILAALAAWRLRVALTR